MEFIYLTGCGPQEDTDSVREYDTGVAFAYTGYPTRRIFLIVGEDPDMPSAWETIAAPGFRHSLPTSAMSPLLPVFYKLASTAKPDDFMGTNMNQPKPPVAPKPPASDDFMGTNMNPPKLPAPDPIAGGDFANTGATDLSRSSLIPGGWNTPVDPAAGAFNPGATPADPSVVPATPAGPPVSGIDSPFYAQGGAVPTAPGAGADWVAGASKAPLRTHQSWSDVDTTLAPGEQAPPPTPEQVFYDSHKTTFDPKSRMDRGKMQAIKARLATQPTPVPGPPPPVADASWAAPTPPQAVAPVQITAPPAAPPSAAAPAPTAPAAAPVEPAPAPAATPVATTPPPVADTSWQAAPAPAAPAATPAATTPPPAAPSSAAQAFRQQQEAIRGEQTVVGARPEGAGWEAVGTRSGQPVWGKSNAPAPAAAPQAVASRANPEATYADAFKAVRSPGGDTPENFRKLNEAKAGYQKATDQFQREMDRHRSLQLHNPAAYAQVERAARTKYGIGNKGYYGTLFDHI